MGVEHAGADFYKVDSDTSTRKYTVELNDVTGYECNCTAFAIKRNKEKSRLPTPPMQFFPLGVTRQQYGTCKHIDQAVAEMVRSTKAEIAEFAAQSEQDAAVAKLRDIAKDLME